MIKKNIIIEMIRFYVIVLDEKMLHSFSSLLFLYMMICLSPDRQAKW